MRSFRIIFLLITWGTIVQIHAQDPTRFQSQIDQIVKENASYQGKEGIIIFTGSSSIRMWGDIAAYFGKDAILNHGFGGSQMMDLEFYLSKIVLEFKPKTVFIYEGDNDINAGKSAKGIMASTKRIVKRIRKDLPQTHIIFISPKPSLSRAHLKDKYEQLNRRLKKFTRKKEYLHFADVWTPMMGPDGNVMPDIFIDDGLHLNEKGYQIWKKVIAPFL